jgi:NAD(P)-dependent dehydrogenase (short-subunit alcohol dehydrogenase family)
MTDVTLIVGAAEGSLGEAIGRNLVVPFTTAGINDEEHHMDVRDHDSISGVLADVKPKNIVVTVGVNEPAKVLDIDYCELMAESFLTNCLGVMDVLRLWCDVDLLRDHQFVAISSNSAHIVRRNSGPYCASKAALSMALRVAAREFAGQPLVYGYEFGLLAGTPMTQLSEQVFGPSQSRMVGAEKGLSKNDAAIAVTQNLHFPWHGLNGVMLRLDAGEQ